MNIRIIIIILIFVKFFKDYNRYKAEIFRVNLVFNKLSNDISLMFVAQNFSISTCLRMSTFWVFINFLEDGNRYKSENFRVYLLFNELSNDISFVFVA